MDNLYRLYTQNKEGEIINDSFDSIFDLIGQKEPDQTKALGYVLAKSNAAMKSFLKIVGLKIKNVSPRIVDCELTQPKGLKESDRADIVVRFPDDKQAIFVEAKSASLSIGSTGASIQVEGYLNRFTNFDGYNSKLVTLTSYSSVSQTGDVKNITWSNIIDAFLKLEENEWIVRDYVNYLLKINRVMFYDIEVLSIPAGGTIDGVTKAGVYECPSDVAPYKSRGEHKPLFMAFRGEKGKVEKLYKVEEVISTPIAGPVYAIAKEKLRHEFVEKIEKYKEIVKYDTENGDERFKWVFFLDEKNSIDLPLPVIYKKNNSFVETQRPLRDYFDKEKKDGDFIVFS